jgi:hypothetical protein
MAVRATRVGAAAYAAASGALPAGWAAGDLALCWAYRDGSTTAPTMPAGWTAIGGGTQSGSTQSCRYGYRRLQAGDTDTGTWTNATELAVIVFRDAIIGQDGLGTIGGTNGTGTSMNYKGLAAEAQDASSIAVQFGGHRTATNVGTTPPAGYTVRATAPGGSVAVFTDEDGSFGSTDSAQTVNASSGWSTNAFEVKSELDLVATTLEVVGFAGAAANTVSLAGIPWAVGDLAYVYAINEATGAGQPQPSVPAGWTANGLGHGPGGSVFTTRAGYRYLQAGDTTIGTWTNATDVLVVVFRNPHATTPVGQIGSPANSGAAGVAPDYGGLFTDADDSIVLVFAANGATTAGFEPEGLTLIGAGGTTIQAWYSVEGTPHLPATVSRNGTAGTPWRTHTYEIKAGSVTAAAPIFQARWLD